MGGPASNDNTRTNNENHSAIVRGLSLEALNPPKSNMVVVLVVVLVFNTAVA